MKKTIVFYIKALLFGILFSLVFWLGEAAMHAFAFHGGAFASQIWPHDPNEIWMRFFIALLFIAMALLSAYYMQQKMTLSRKVKLAYRALAVMREGCVITDSHNQIIFVNKRYEEISEYTSKEVVGKNPNVLGSGKQDKQFYKALWEQLLAKGYWEGEVWNRKRSGELYPQWTNISTILAPLKTGVVTFVIMSGYSVISLHKKQRKKKLNAMRIMTH